MGIRKEIDYDLLTYVSQEIQHAWSYGLMECYDDIGLYVDVHLSFPDWLREEDIEVFRPVMEEYKRLEGYGHYEVESTSPYCVLIRLYY